MTKAKKENKMIFMDCYTSWCGPCKMLAKEVFTDPDAAKFFNEKFVNVKFDMEKGEGKMLKDKYGVKAYPTLYFINVAGEVEHCVVGGPDLAGLLKAGQDALEGSLWWLTWKHWKQHIWRKKLRRYVWSILQLWIRQN